MAENDLVTESVVTGPGPLFVCDCCREHNDLGLLWGPPATCPTCGNPCSCAGCHAETEERNHG